MTVRDDMKICLGHLLPIGGSGWSAGRVRDALAAHWLGAQVELQDVVDTLMDGLSVGVVEYAEDGYRLCSYEKLAELVAQEGGAPVLVMSPATEDDRRLARRLAEIIEIDPATGRFRTPMRDLIADALAEQDRTDLEDRSDG